MTAQAAQAAAHWAALLALAQEAAVEAGAGLLAQARPWARSDLRVRSKSSSTDVVTAMDVASERGIINHILAARPGDTFVAEEGTHDAHSAADGAVTWVVDPLDGTVNYLYGLPHWAVSIAAVSQGQVVAGVVHVPAVGETFTAIRGGGAQLHTTTETVPLRLDPIAPALGQALVATGFGYRASRRQRQAVVAAHLLPRVRDIRRLGAAAIDLCHVALGRVDGFYELGLQPWDVAAGALVVTEAGGRVEGLHGAVAGEPFDVAEDPRGPGMTIAAGAGLFPTLHEALVAAGEDGSVLPSEPTVP